MIVSVFLFKYSKKSKGDVEVKKSIEVQFDEEMLEYIQDLQLKTVTFGGYDRDDVFAQFRALINKARDVCSGLTEQMVSETERGVISNFAKEEGIAEDYPDENSLLEQMKIAQSTIEALQRELQAVESEAHEAKGREHNAVKALNQEKLDYQNELEKLQSEVSELKQENAELQKQKTEEEQRQETMDQASAILREARLEGARLIDDARAKIDQEILLGRALSKEEESKAKKDIQVLTDELDELAQACLEHRRYLSQSTTLLLEVLQFAETGENMATAALDRSHNDQVNAVLDRYEQDAETEEEWQEEDEYWQPEVHHEPEQEDAEQEEHSDDVWHPETEWQPEELIASEDGVKPEDDILEGLAYEEGGDSEH